MHTKSKLWLLLIGACTSLAACNGSSSDDPEPGPNPTPPPSLSCDESIQENFKPDDQTTVLLVKSFKEGDPITLGEANSRTPTASQDICLVKLNVGPGNPGPEDAPSTSPGIGIEVWFPTDKDDWSHRLRALGGGGWAGGAQGSTTDIGDSGAGRIASDAGDITASTDTGHPGGNGAFAMLPDGTINTALWKDFAERSLHETAVKAKALAEAYYGEAPSYSYWVGGSTGGRQGLNLAQNHPDDFDGMIAGYPAINWSKFITTELYPQIVIQRDLGGNPLSNDQLNAVSNAAINACDKVGDVHLGYIPDPLSCHYDPTQDVDILCADTGGNNATEACLSPAQALAVNKFWYGQTTDGSVPDPAMDNASSDTLSGKHRWYGVTRGASLTGLSSSRPFAIAVDQVALELQDSSYADPSFKNATGDGQSKWKELSYDMLSYAFDRGVALQQEFGGINTDNPDLTAYRDRGGKILTHYGLADPLIPPQGTMHYYRRVAEEMGGVAAVQDFFRVYYVPGMGHGLNNGTSNPDANPPLPTDEQLFQLLTDWVENGKTPSERVDVTSRQPAEGYPEGTSRPICVYPMKAKFIGGDPKLATGYECSAS